MKYVSMCVCVCVGGGGVLFLVMKDVFRQKIDFLWILANFFIYPIVVE